MENFIEHMATVCLLFAIIGSIFGGFVFIGEKLITKFNLQDKLVNFMFGTDNED